MASTRNKNTPINYSLEQKQNVQSEDWSLYYNGANGYAYDTKLPGLGLGPARMHLNCLSYNPTEIESFLYGINSTNLVNAAPPLTPHLRHLQSVDIFKKQDIIMPVPFVASKNERPFPA